MSELQRALVVDDDPSWQGILGEILADAGLAVDVAAGYDQAVACLRAARHRLAVVDLSLAGSDYQNRDGLRVLDALRRHDPGCVALLLTGFATVEIAVSALTEHGAFTCLRKESFSRAGLQDALRRALAIAPPPEPTGAEAAAGPVSDLAAPAGAEQALLVDDDAGWRGILGELLSEAGYRVRACTGYGEARGCLRRERYSLAVIDLSLAPTPTRGENLDGFRLLACTRGAGIPTIVVSGVAEPEHLEQAYEKEGIFAGLEKQSFDRRAFLRTVAEARAARRGPVQVERLTEREREVLQLVGQGKTNKEIAQTLVISGNTVKRHLKAVFEKLAVHTRAAAAAKAISAGLSPGPESEDPPA